MIPGRSDAFFQCGELFGTGIPDPSQQGISPVHDVAGASKLNWRNCIFHQDMKIMETAHVTEPSLFTLSRADGN